MRIRARLEETYKDPNLPAPAKLESLDFDSINSPYWLDLARRPPRTVLGYSGKTFTRWMLSIVIGFLVALAARAIAFGVGTLGGFRNRLFFLVALAACSIAFGVQPLGGLRTRTLQAFFDSSDALNQT
jgi:hypothetical protein